MSDNNTKRSKEVYGEEDNRNSVQSNFFELQQIYLPTVKERHKDSEPYIDYLKSIWMTQHKYLNLLKQTAKHKEEATKKMRGTS